jgi:hypothetical protein
MGGAASLHVGNGRLSPPVTERAWRADGSRLPERWEEALEEFEEVELRPRRVDMDVELVAIGWVPHWLRPDGREEPAI